MSDAVALMAIYLRPLMVTVCITGGVCKTGTGAVAGTGLVTEAGFETSIGRLCGVGRSGSSVGVSN